MEYVNASLTPLCSDNLNKFHGLMKFIREKDKEGEVLLLFRGEEQRNVKRRLFGVDSKFESGEMFQRAFYFGEKARHFSVDHSDGDRSALTDINDISDHTLEFIFERIANVINIPERRYHVLKNTSSKFREYFFEPSNRRDFLERVNGAHTSTDKLKVRDYYLYWLHTAGSPGIRLETHLVSTSIEKRIARYFSTVKKSTKDNFIFHYFIPKPFHLHAISPWLSDHHQLVVSDCGLPTYKSLGLYPNQKEVAVKGALFPHFILGVELVAEKKFVVNSHAQHIHEYQYEEISKSGFPIDQTDFAERIFNTGYIRWVQTDLNGNFNQTDV